MIRFLIISHHLTTCFQWFEFSTYRENSPQQVRVSGLSPDTTATGLFRQLDLWGLGGATDGVPPMT